MHFCKLLLSFTLLGASLGELQSPLTPSKEKIAIIGAGAGGSSASYYLQKFTSDGFNITLFEAEHYIGGRSTTISNYSPNNSTNFSIELGASVFVGANRILWNGVREFNLTTTSFDLSDKYPDKFKGDFGVWNGTDFVFRTNGDESTIGGIFKIFWKYGLSPLRLYWLVRNTVGDFVHFFYYTYFPFQLDGIVSRIGFDQLTNSTGAFFLAKKKISEDFANDIVEASTRVNYASNLNGIHGLETVVSMAAEKAVQVVGGNYQIFEGFIKHSGANLLLNTRVSKLRQLNGKWIVETGSGQIDEFDQVIIAAPLHLSQIEIEGENITELEEVEYRDLHVTFVSTPKSNPIENEYFGKGQVPELILTRSSTSNIPFFSINIVEYDNVTDTIFYKIFSPNPIDEKILSEYLFEDLTDVSIIFTKLWNPYPILKPKDHFNNFQIGEKLWYLNSIEEFISTMETSALAGASVAGLISAGKNTTEISLPFY